uniref:Uncharacterized protein n=1 Tax=Quercus lobata TaxID=97700 RepID=A0A7N2R493_QUELO
MLEVFVLNSHQATYLVSLVISLLPRIETQAYETCLLHNIDYVASFLGGRCQPGLSFIMTRGFSVENKALPTIMGTNLYPIDHLANLNSSHSIYDVIKGASIDICYHIYHCFCQQGSQTSSSSGLLFPPLVLNICGYFSVNRLDPYTSLPRVGPISSSILARIRVQIEKNKEKGSSSHQEAPGFGGANVDLDAEIDRMLEEGAPPSFDMPDIQAKFEELLIQIASGFSHMDSLFVDMYTDLTVLTRVDGIEQFLHVLSPPPPSPPTEDYRI